MNGIILIDKPIGISSYDVIRQLKRYYPGRKIGHAGTLDPLASGLLIVLVGSATKLSNFLMVEEKAYTGTIVFGFKYDSYDIDGNIIDNRDPIINNEDIKRGFIHFNGLTYDQVPPIYSALKVKGKKAYELARSGQEVKLTSRNVTIYQFIQTSPYQNNEVDFYSRVSKKVYIRSLAYDLGNYLNEFAAIKSLRRVMIGRFDIKDANSIEDHRLMSLKEYFSHEDKYSFDEKTTKLVKNGATIVIQVDLKINQIVIIDNNEEIIALYQRVDRDKFKPLVMFWGNYESL